MFNFLLDISSRIFQKILIFSYLNLNIAWFSPLISFSDILYISRYLLMSSYQKLSSTVNIVTTFSVSSASLNHIHSITLSNYTSEVNYKCIYFSQFLVSVPYSMLPPLYSWTTVVVSWKSYLFLLLAQYLF
jgi:hypothetical protein